MHRLVCPATAELIVKKSRFIGLVFPVTGRADAQSRLAQTRLRFPGAAHYCSVLICAEHSGLDDDGEPGGTAARPMYNVLTHKDVTDVFAVVVRYWGGIKLGAGGLARAYGQVVSDAMKGAELAVLEPMCALRLGCAFADESTLRRLAEQRGFTVLSASYGESVTLDLRLPCKDAAAFERDARDALRGMLSVMPCPVPPVP